MVCDCSLGWVCRLCWNYQSLQSHPSETVVVLAAGVRQVWVSGCWSEACLGQLSVKLEWDGPSLPSHMTECSGYCAVEPVHCTLPNESVQC